MTKAKAEKAAETKAVNKAANPPATAPAKKMAPIVTGGTVAALVPANLDDQWRIATIVQAAKMAPKSYDNDANKIMVGIMAGAEVGLPPMVALQSIAVINNVPSLWGDGLLAVCRASTLMEDFDEYFTFDSENNAIAATCMVKRKGDARVIERVFTRAQAVKAGLWGKKDPWQKYPDRMLQMRARAFALRDAFADVLKGLGSAEERVDGGNLVEQEDGTYAAPPRPVLGEYEREARAQAAAVGLTPDPDGVVEHDVTDAIRAEQSSAEDPVESVYAAAGEAGEFAFNDLDGHDRVFAGVDDAAGTLEHEIERCKTKEDAATLWEDNKTFRDAVKAANPKRALTMRNFYGDVTGNGG